LFLWLDLIVFSKTRTVQFPDVFVSGFRMVYYHPISDLVLEWFKRKINRAAPNRHSWQSTHSLRLLSKLCFKTSLFNNLEPGLGLDQSWLIQKLTCCSKTILFNMYTFSVVNILRLSRFSLSPSIHKNIQQDCFKSMSLGVEMFFFADYCYIAVLRLKLLKLCKRKMFNNIFFVDYVIPED
jgi:hypothetical protein